MTQTFQTSHFPIPIPLTLWRSAVWGFFVALLLGSCTTLRLPDGAYIPALPQGQQVVSQVTMPPVATPVQPQPTTSLSQAHTSAASALGITPSGDDNAQLLITCASYLGVPYRYAGNDRSGLDCSGLTTRIYSEVYGIALHRRSIDQFQKDITRRTSQPQQGDLVFFTTNGRGTCSHVGIYIGEGRFVHASTRRGVVVDKLESSYYATRFLGAGSPKK